MNVIVKGETKYLWFVVCGLQLIKNDFLHKNHSIIMVKLKRNDKCHCKSGKKYKTCCLEEDEKNRLEQNQLLNDMYENGHEISFELTEFHDFLTTEYKKYKIIDVTNVLTSTNYRQIQTKHLFANTIIIANRTDENDEVFRTRGDGATDWIVMFRGAHQVFNSYSFDKMKPEIKDMISTRLRGEDYALM